MTDSRNLILAILISAAVLFGWSVLQRNFAPPASLPPTASTPATVIAGGRETVLPAPAADPAADSPAAARDRAVVLRETPRVRIATPVVEGSLNLVGARIDDLVLVRYNETVAKGSPRIRLLSPGGAERPYFAAFGFSGTGAPPANARWRASGDTLAPGRPVTLSWSNPAGQTFEIVLSIADDYLFRAEHRIVNRSAAAIVARPYALLARTGIGSDADSFTAHFGPTAVFDRKLTHVNWDETVEAPGGVRFGGKGWLGFSDKYWLTALIADPATVADGSFRGSAGERHQADLSTAPLVAGPGQVAMRASMLFAGAKEVAVLQRIENRFEIAAFDNAIDWGWFWFIAKPIFHLLDWLFGAIGNFGVAIMLLTLIVRLILFPVASKQFQAMNKMRVLAPKLKALQERYKEDKEGLQREMMAFYKAEKVNPVSGCLPIFLQMPIFFALYKVLLLTIEMRHQPFVLWIRDLSAADPLTPLNLFGLLPFTPPHIIAIGVLPIIMGVTMWGQQKLNPAATDPVQRQIFALMPWVFMFVMAPFAAGLVIYWTTNNTLSILQQLWLARKMPAPATA